MKVDNIIIATDMSESSADAAIWGMAFAKQLGVEVVIAHVVEVSMKGWIKGTFDILEDEKKLSVAQSRLREWCVKVTGSAPDAVEIRAGGTLHQLKQIAIDWTGNSVVVIAQSGASKLAKFLLGSTASRLAAQPPCPLVVVHPEHTTISKGSVICGTDFSENAGLALEFAKFVCRVSESKLTIAHGHRAPVLGSIFDAGGEAVLALQESVKEIAESNLENLLNTQEFDGVEYKSVIVEDEPSSVVLALAVTEKADLIIMGHGGESPLVQNILGSVAQKVLAKMPATMIIVPENH